MVRHYKKLQEIKDKPTRPRNVNATFIKKKIHPKRVTRHDKEQTQKVKDDNTKLVKALENIASTFGK